MVVPAAPDDTRSGVSTTSTATTPDPDRPGRSRGPARLVILLVLVVALVVGLVLTAVGFTTRSDPGFGLTGQPEQVQSEREDVMAQAEQFLLRINTYGPDLLEGDQMPEYRKQVSAVITPKFDTDFEKNVPAAEATVVQAGLARTATVVFTAVSAMDDDSATALVAGSFTNSYPKTQGSTERVTAPPSPFRVQVELVKVKGAWLVDDFDPVTGLDDEQGGTQPTDPASTTLPDPASLLPTTEPTDAPTGATDPSTQVSP